MSQPMDDAAPESVSAFWDHLGEAPQPEAADWSGDELEQAYLRAIEVLEASDAELPGVDPSQPDPVDGDSLHSTLATVGLSDPPVRRERIGVAEPVVSVAGRADAAKELEQLAARRVTATAEQPFAVQPRQILEALLFVGGDALTAKKMSGVLRGEFSIEYIERELDELNRLYAAEGRPYEIRLGEGGYRLVLREDFERIRSKVYGQGPKEVRLSQEAIEVLAIVAYQQPISDSEIEALGKPSCGSILRQLLRRELIAVKRQPDKPRDVVYQTTTRFLSLFGIRSLDELPRHEQVGYK